MAKALFFSLPLTGHINPSLPLVRALADRGDEVVYYATEPFAARIEAANARFRRYRNAFLTEMSGLPERLDELSWLFMRATAELLAHDLQAFRAERPDYVITDSVAPWGQWIAEILGVPVVTSVCTFAVNRRVLAYALAHRVRPSSAGRAFSKIRYMARAILLGRQLRRRYAVRGPGVTGLVLGRSDLNIVYTSRHFQPCAESFADRFQFVGPSMAARNETSVFPWEQLRHPVVIYASMGTLFNRDAVFYRNCFEAFRNQNFQVILSTGSNIPAASLSPAPQNFIMQSHVPQLDVLGRAAVFVTHGGMNSVNESLSHGVPLVVIPQMSEQQLVGRRVEELGAGIYLAKEDATPEKLRDAVRRILAEPGFRRQAAAVRDSFQTAGGVARAAAAIFAFTRPCDSRSSGSARSPESDRAGA